MDPTDVVKAYFEAMRLGEEAAEDLLALFAEDATYIEPFSGAQLTHVGKAQIEAQLRRGWQTAPPDLTLVVDRIDVEGQVVTSHWTCTSPVFPHPMKGRDVATVRDGLIRCLDVRMLP